MEKKRVRYRVRYHDYVNGDHHHHHHNVEDDDDYDSEDDDDDSRSVKVCRAWVRGGDAPKLMKHTQVWPWC